MESSVIFFLRTQNWMISDVEPFLLSWVISWRYLKKNYVIEQIMFCIVLSIIKSFATSQQKTQSYSHKWSHQWAGRWPKNIIHVTCYPGGILAKDGQSTLCSLSNQLWYKRHNDILTSDHIIEQDDDPKTSVAVFGPSGLKFSSVLKIQY